MQLRTLILINMGSIIDLPSEEWFGDFPDYLRVHIIDSNRPQNLASLFGPDEKIVVWDDGGADDLEEEKKAWEALAYAPEEDDDSDSEEDSEDDEDEDDEEPYGSSSSGKRRLRVLRVTGRSGSHDNTRAGPNQSRCDKPHVRVTPRAQNL